MRVAARRALWAAAALAAVPVLADAVQWSMWRQQLQRSADALAIRAGLGLPAGEGVEGRLARIASRNRLAALPVVEHPPASGPFAGDAGAVRVTLVADRAPFFSSRLFGPSRMRARATVAWVPTERPGHKRLERVE